MASFNSVLPPTKVLRSNWVVQKFGGTSVGKFALNIIEQVVLYALSNLPFGIHDIATEDTTLTRVSDLVSQKTELLWSAQPEAVRPKPRALPTGES